MDFSQPEKLAERYCPSCKSFFASQAFDWLCSGCFKNKKNEEDKQTAVRGEVQTPKIPLVSEAPMKDTSAPEPKQVMLGSKQIDRSRCSNCSKKVGLLGVDCRCGLTFCNLHRMPEDHSCAFDYRKQGKQKLAKEHKKVVASKIQHI